jgi:DNA-binding response OmpR family regulator
VRHFACTLARRLSQRPPLALIADPDPPTQRLLSQHLTSDGFAIDLCSDGRDALERVIGTSFDLIVLDSGLQGVDGITLCRVIRQGSINRDAAIIVVSPSSRESEKVLTLIGGADDYLTKPVSVREFLARVSTIMRRTRPPAPREQNPIERRDFSLDPARRQLVVRGRRVPLSKQEFELLYDLASSPGIVFTRQDLLLRHWPHAKGSDIRLIDPIVSRLRRKIEAERDSPRLLVTVWGVGYKFAE